MTASTETPHPTLPAGTLLAGRYRVQSPLGFGGFGHVYRGQDLRLQREVAIKVLNVHSDPSVEARFEREARAAGQLRHPNVVEVYDIGVDPVLRAPFMVMELLQGHDLQVEVAQCGRLTPARIIPLFVDALEALGSAHDRGIVHKDLKPENLFLTQPHTRHELLKVLDFGVAAFMQDAARLTVGEQFFGTPLYLAPEYIQSRAVSPAVDVYQMGLVLAEVLIGQPVINPENIHLCLIAHCDGDLQLPQSLLDSPLGPILFGALHRDPLRRYPDGHAFASALSTIDPGAVPIPHPSEVRWRVSALSASHRTIAHPDRTDLTHDLAVDDPDAIEDSLVGRLLGGLNDTLTHAPPDAFAAGLWSHDVHASGPELDLVDDSEPLPVHPRLLLDPPTLPPGDARMLTPSGEGLTAPDPPRAHNAQLPRPPRSWDDLPIADPLDRALTSPVPRPARPAPWHHRTSPRLIIAAALLVALGALALWRLTSPPAPPPPPTPALATSTAPAPDDALRPRPHTVRLDTTPLGATVLDGERPVGTTPLILPVDAAPRLLTLTLHGFRSEQIVLSPDSPDDLLIPLQPNPEAADAPAQPARRRAVRPGHLPTRPTRPWKIPD